MFLWTTSFRKCAKQTWPNFVAMWPRDQPNVNRLLQFSFVLINDDICLMLDLKCLLEAQSTQTNKFTQRCAEALKSRAELWKMVQLNQQIGGINDLAYLINASESRSYLFAILILIIFTVFLLGCVCKPAVFRKRFDKLKQLDFVETYNSLPDNKIIKETIPVFVNFYLFILNILFIYKVLIKLFMFFYFLNECLNIMTLKLFFKLNEKFQL